MKSLLEEFEESLKAKPETEQDLFTACQLIKVCRDYVETHYKHAVFGTFQKNLLELLNEFLKSQERKRFGQDAE